MFGGFPWTLATPDAPPPLQDLADQVQALELRQSGQAPAAGSLSVASTTIVHQPATKPRPAPAIKKGFFDAKPSKPKAAAAGGSSSNRSTSQSARQKGSTTGGGKGDDDVEEIPVIRAAKPAGGGIGSGGPAIPDFMRIQPDEQALKYQAMKSQMLEALKPDESMVMDMAKDGALVALFDDPEVMKAVDEVAKSPAAFAKYSKNAKVMKFYELMGNFCGGKLQQKGVAVGGSAAAAPPANGGAQPRASLS